MKAAVYCRISLDRKVPTGDGGAGEYTMLGVQRQEQDCRELCARMGWDVAQVYVDNDVSASTGKRRPAYEAMLQALAAGHVEAIVCWHPDRLYRRTTDLETLVEVVEKTRSPIATVNAGEIDLTTPTGRLVARLLGATARYEVEHKTERWKRGVRQKREQGIPFASGPRLYGYTRDGQVVDAEREHLLWAADQLLTGAPLAEVARGLTARGARTSKGNAWSGKSLVQTLRNPRIAGWITHDGQRVARSKWPALMTEDKWEVLQARISRKRTTTPRPRVASLLGIARCAHCGARLITSYRTTTRKGERALVRTYRCPVQASSSRDNGNGCVEVVAERLEAMVEEYARVRLDDDRVQQRVAALTSSSRAQQLAQDVAKYEARLVELANELADGDAPVRELRLAMDRVRDQLTDAQRKLADATGTSTGTPGPVATWPTDPAKRGALVQLVVEQVVVRKAPHSGGALHDRVDITPRVQ